MGGSKAKPIKTPFEQKQTNTFAPFSISDTPEARAFLETPLDFGGGSYAGDAYKDYTGDAYKDYSGQAYRDIKDDFKFNIDPGVGRRTDLAEQEAANRWDSAFMAGVPAFVREQAKQKELRGIRSQGAAERQQAEYTRQNAQQQADYQSSLARAGMRDAAERALAEMRDTSELNRARFRDESERTRAQMGDEATRARTLAELDRRNRLLPGVFQTGGSSSGYNTQITQPTPGFLQSFFGGGGAAGIAGVASKLPMI